MFGQNYISVMNSSDYKPVAVGAVDPAALSFAKNTSLRGNSPATDWYRFHLYTAQSPLRMIYWTSYASFDRPTSD